MKPISGLFYILLTSLIMFLPVLGQAQSGRALQIQGTTILQGQSGTAIVNLQAQGDENGVGFSLAFDPMVVGYTGASLGADAASSGATLVVNDRQATNGQLGIILSLPTGNAFSTGTRQLLKLNFQALTAASVDSALSFTDHPVRRDVANTNAVSVAATYVNGSISLNPMPPSLPSVVVFPTNRLVPAGSSLTFIATASGTSPFSYQWMFGGAPIVGATKSAYDIAAVQAPNSGDYVVAVSNAAGSVTSAPPAHLAVFTWATPSAVTYGTRLSSDQLNAQATVPGTFDYTPATGTLLGAGTHALSVIFTPTDALDYTSLTGSVSLVVSPASLEITANDTNKSYGQTVSFSGKEFTASGLINSDAVTAVNLTSIGAAATAVVAGSPYSIVPDGATGSGLTNYNIHYHNGSLTMSKTALAVTADNTNRLYGMPNPPFTGTVTGLQNADNITASFSCSATSTSPAGQYAIVPTLEDPQSKLANYTLTIFIGTMTVISAPARIDTTLLSGQSLLLSIPSINGFQYVLESKQALGDPAWNVVQTNTGTGGILAFSNYIGANPFAFYRIRIH